MNETAKNLVEALKASLENPKALQFELEEVYDRNAWDNATPEKVGQFYDIVYEAACKIFGVDSDGDLGFRITMAVKRDYEPNHFFDIPSWNKAKTGSDKLRILELCAANVSMASDKLKRFMEIMRSEEHQEQDSAEAKAKRMRVEVKGKVSELLTGLAEEIKTTTRVPFDPETDVVVLRRDDNDLPELRVNRGHKCIGVMWPDEITSKIQRATGLNPIATLNVAETLAVTPSKMCDGLNFEEREGSGFSSGWIVTKKDS